MAFFLKKLVGALLMPLPMGFILLAVGAVLIWRRWQKCGVMLIVTVLSGWFMLSLTPVVKVIMAPLEFRYPAYASQKVDAVVVLGGYHRSDSRIPLSSLLSATSLNRLLEGMLILDQHPTARLAVSGYAGNDVISNARAMAQVAEGLGLAPSRIMLAEGPKDTAEEAAHWAKVLRGQRVALVTSALHMPRAVYLFEQAGMRVVPAPTRYLSAGPSDYDWRGWVPSAHNLEYARQAWHEYLGLLWARINT